MGTDMPQHQIYLSISPSGAAETSFERACTPGSEGSNSAASCVVPNLCRQPTNVAYMVACTAGC